MKDSFFLLLAVLAPFYSNAEEKMNVLIILSDDHARNVLGCYGNDIVKTPNIDNLAKKSMVFDNAYCNAPISSASRASILTGKYPHSTGLNLLFTPFVDEDNITIAEILRDSGYVTALFGKTHFNNWIWGNLYKDGLPNHGFDLIVEKEDYNQFIKENKISSIPDTIATYNKSFLNDSIPIFMNSLALPSPVWDKDAPGTFFANKVAEFITDNAKTPFFVWYAPHEPHHPYEFPIEYRNKYNPDNFKLPQGSDEDDRWVPKCFRGLTERDKKGIISAYYTSVEYMDKNIGIVLNALKKNGLEDKTLIIYISDNGYLLNEHKRFEKHTMWQECVNQPLIIKGPSIKGGKRSNAMVEYIDIVPTILDYVGYNIPSFIQGKSFKSLLYGENNIHKDYVYSFYLEDNMAMISSENWKYIFHTGCRDLGIGYETGEGPAGITHFLYDKKNDPNEHHNLANNVKYKLVLDKMQSLLIKHFKENHPEGGSLPKSLTNEGALVWFCEPRDRGALPNIEAKPLNIRNGINR